MQGLGAERDAAGPLLLPPRTVQEKQEESAALLHMAINLWNLLSQDVATGLDGFKMRTSRNKSLEGKGG